MIGLRWAAGVGIAAMGTMPLAAPAPPQAQATEDVPEIVVIGRKLRKVRINYAMRGRSLHSCTTEVSSGDPRIDRIMCAILRACVQSGRHAVAAAKACMAARVDSLSDAAEAAMLARAGRAEAASPAPPAQAPARRDDEIVVTGRSEPDIVVTGSNPTMRGGLWEFRRTATMGFGGSGAGRSSRFTQCLPDGAIEAMLRRAAGERFAAPGGDLCGSMRLKFGDGRLNGSRSCSRSLPVPGGGFANGTDRLTLTGRYDARRLMLNYNIEQDFDGLERGGGQGWNPRRPVGYRWLVTATRQGECPLKERRDDVNVTEAVSALFSVRGPNED